MYLRFIIDTFGLEGRPKWAKLVAVTFPIVMVIGAYLIFR